MAKLLYIECSPRKQISASIEVCRAFLDAYRAANPADTIQTLDIWDLACRNSMATRWRRNTQA
jgi:FMN-dependent NADH-azoreductase